MEVTVSNIDADIMSIRQQLASLQGALNYAEQLKIYLLKEEPVLPTMDMEAPDAGTEEPSPA
jgi:hypothetical protein